MPPKTPAKGFTLVEIVVTLTLVATIAMLMATGVLPHIKGSVDPQIQVRASQFGQSVMKEILSKSFDEATPVGGTPPCSTCTSSGSFGPDAGETGRALYDDVDDYNAYCAAPVAAADIEGSTDGLTGFSLQVCVIYDGDYNGLSDADNSAKLIALTVFFPGSAGSTGSVAYHAYRSNF